MVRDFTVVIQKHQQIMKKEIDLPQKFLAKQHVKNGRKKPAI
jgi:hypothetical protein